MSSSRAVELVKTLTQHAKATNCFERVLSKVKLIPSEEGRMLAQVKVSEEHLNVGGTAHGGFIATLVDYVSTLALLNRENGSRGTSVDINVNYVNAAKVGDTMEVDAKVVKLGKRIAFLAVEVRNKDTKKIFATGTHTKFVG